MVGRLTLVVVTAVVVAVAVFVLPSPYGIAFVTGCATLAFGIYVLRERAAIRGLFRGIELVRRRSDDMLAEVERRLGEDRDELHVKLREATDRFREVASEIVGLHAAATNEILGQSRAQRAVVDRIADDVAGTSTRLTGLKLTGLDRIMDGLASLSTTLGHTPTQTELRRLQSEALIAASRDFRQTEALFCLYTLFPVRAPVPPSRKWAASPDLLLYLTSVVLDRRPATVVELGGGLSTLWLSYAMEKSNHGGRIISLDHDAGFADKTRTLLATHDLAKYVDVRNAPIVDLELGGEIWPWYDRTALADVDECDLLIVDGPPGATRDRARYPALPMLAERLAPSAIVVLDDCIRDDEKDIVERWREEYPEWTVEMIDHEKGTGVLSR
jgi:predicted O-methyltransferase YrrM